MPVNRSIQNQQIPANGSKMNEHLSRVLKHCMQFSVEKAGAQFGSIFYRMGGNLCLGARVINRGCIDIVANNPPFYELNCIPKTVLAYALQTRDILFLPDVQHDNPFAEDPYIRKQKPIACLCIPLIVGTTLVGMIYLESKFGEYAFSHNHILEVRKIQNSLALSVGQAL